MLSLTTFVIVSWAPCYKVSWAFQGEVVVFKARTVWPHHQSKEWERLDVMESMSWNEPEDSWSPFEGKASLEGSDFL